MRQINQLTLGQKVGLKQMIMHVERITTQAKLSFKVHC